MKDKLEKAEKAMASLQKKLDDDKNDTKTTKAAAAVSLFGFTVSLLII